MKRATIAMLAFLGCMTLFALAVRGDFASPTTTDYETTTTTTTTTAAAEMTQTHNRSVCVGILNFGSCNTTQVTVQTQAVHGRTAGSPAPTQQGMTGAQMVGTLVLLCVAFVVVMGFAGVVMGNRGLKL